MSRNKPVRKVRTIGIRISDEQYNDLTRRAAEKGMSLTDFQRLIVLQALYAPSETRLMLAEMIRLQKIILSFHATVLNGGSLTRERIDSIVREADQGKFELADQRIAAGLNAPSTLAVLKAFGGQNA